MERKSYFLGLCGDEKLVIEKTDLFYYYSKGSFVQILLQGNRSDNSMRVFIRETGVDEFVGVEENEIEKNVKKILNEDGSRWEGDWHNEKPFGFGSLFDGEGNRIYSGFMYVGKKVGFGTEYFADNHNVDYCGNFMNDKRHGWGITFDRNGQKLYEGDWRCGKNDFEDKIVIENEDDDLRIHDLIKELEIGENCLNEWEDDLMIDNYPNLTKIVVKKNSLKNLNSLKICNCENLKTIEIEDSDDWDDSAFNNVKNVIIESI